MIISGKKIAAELQNEMIHAVAKFQGRKPALAVILVGRHPPSLVYVGRKVAACEEVGIKSIRYDLPENCSEELLLSTIKELNEDPAVDGILMQLPLPKQLDPIKAIFSISPDKDVDGLHPINMGKLLSGNPDGFVPCTPLGIQVLLEMSEIPTQGRHVVILGRSNLVGKPLAALLMQNRLGANATVTVANSYTENLMQLTQSADILVAAMGKAKFVTAEMVSEGATVIDVGINYFEGKIVGDVDFENVKEKCGFITPVPGGVGPMTIAMLLSNTLKSYQRSNDYKL